MSIEAIDHVQLHAFQADGEDEAVVYSGLLGLAERAKPPELAKRGGCWFESDQVKVHCGVDVPSARPAKHRFS